MHGGTTSITRILDIIISNTLVVRISLAVGECKVLEGPAGISFSLL